MQVAAEPVAFAAETAYTIFPRVEGIRQPVMLLNGKWQFKYSSQSRWTVIEVPGEAAMQGYAIGHDKPFFCTGNGFRYRLIMPDTGWSCVLMECIAMRC